MKSIILVQPKGGGFDLLGARLPIGLLSIAASLDKEGYTIKIIDQRTDPEWQKTLLLALRSDPICVGITCMTGRQIETALKASQLVKNNSKCPVIWGGVHASLLPIQTIENKLIDCVAIGEGELTFYELVKALEKNEDLTKVKGIVYKKSDKIYQNPEREFITNLDNLVELPYHLVDIDRYSSINIEGKSLDFVSSRGCFHKCSFCYNLKFNKQRWRAMSAEETVKRVKHLVEKYNIKTIYFQDDNFCANLSRLREILERIIREKIDIKWGTLGLRADTALKMDDNFLKLMYDSGCRNVDIGAESGSDRILGLIDKQIKIDDLVEVNRRLAKYPFIIKYTFIIGFPGETKEEYMQSIKLAEKLVKENHRAYTPFLLFSPYPGTKMYERALEFGLIPPKILEEWTKFSIEDWFEYFPSWLSKSEISKLKSIIFTSLFYNRNIRYKINSRFIKLMFDLYHPIAKFRFSHNFHYFPIEFWLAQKLVYKV